MRYWIGFVILVSAWGPWSAAEEPRMVYETEIEAGVDAVWNAFTSADALTQWMAPVVEIDLAVGGKMRSNYNPEGKIGDGSTIENTILAFDPGHMLALKATGFPAGFPYKDAAASTWSIFYFVEVAPGRTRVTTVGLGYADDPKSQELKGFFEAANKASFAKLKEYLMAPKTP